MISGMPQNELKKMERSAESVTPGHPDKICDRMADMFVDECMKANLDVAPNKMVGRMAAEVTGGHGEVYVTGECRIAGAETQEDLQTFIGGCEKNIKAIYKEITGCQLNHVRLNMVPQSADIAAGVDIGGAGDQGVMIGYATNETPEMLPRPFLLARKITKALYAEAMNNPDTWMQTDGKSVVIMRNGTVASVVVAIQHKNGNDKEAMTEDLLKRIVMPVLGYAPTRFVVNGAGIFCIGGFEADAGTTGRKLIIDNYGPELQIGGGAYSGKDATKVDRSAAYMARYIAKNAVAHGIGGSEKVTVQFAYAIGIEQPEAIIAINQKGVDISGWVRHNFDLSPRGIIERLNLWRPIYQEVCTGGHYGLNHEASDKLDVWTWEDIDPSL
ncbi:MAG: methionine adenosyltransferase domain-containing protein [Candidatus Moraniibacteriota bacterium]